MARFVTGTVVIELLKDSAADEGEEAIQDKLGLTVKGLDKELADQLQLKETTGVIITDLKSDGAAQEAGIAEGDIIKEINGSAIQTLKDYEKAVAAHKKGEIIRFLLKRGDSSLYLAARLD